MTEETYRYYVVYASAAVGNLEWMILNWPHPIETEEDVVKITASLNQGCDHNYTILNWKRLQ